MKYFFFFLYLIHTILYNLVTNEDLEHNNPFSVKLGYDEVAVFLDNYITIYDSQRNNKTQHPISTSVSDVCISGKEKAGIYFNSLYYTSCRTDPSTDSDPFNFFVRICPRNLPEPPECTDIGNFGIFKNSTIKFFKVPLDEDFVGLAYNFGNTFYLYYFKGKEIYRNGNFTKSQIGNFDCLFNNFLQRTICVFGEKSADGTTIIPRLNIFNFGDQESEYLGLKRCSNYYSQKIRGYTNSLQPYSDIFFYYFVDVHHNAYVKLIKLHKDVELRIDDKNCHQIMIQCRAEYYNYDLAENEFMGYNVFSCVDYEDDQRKIKIVIFKIDVVTDNITFYNGASELIPNYKYPTDSTGKRYSMINFVVLKESLSYGFLSFREDDTKASYIIINQPSCNPFPTDNQERRGDNKIGTFQEKVNISFSENIINDGFDNAQVKIVNYSNEIYVNPHDKTLVDVKSNYYNIDSYLFYFKVKNDYFESKICTGIIKVEDNGCFENCKTCFDTNSTSVYEQKCRECKIGYYEMERYPEDTYVGINCCKENDNCPVNYYFSNNKFKKCHQACLTCNGPSDSKCLICYNLKELDEKFSEKKSEIESHRGLLNSSYYYLHNGRCIQDRIKYYYPDDSSGSYKSCYDSCLYCSGYKDGNNHKCTECDTVNGYFFLDKIYSDNCYSREDLNKMGRPNYYKETNTTFSMDYWKKCYDTCKTCEDYGLNRCTECKIDKYPKCSNKDDTYKECFSNPPDTSYYLDKSRRCYMKCSSKCKSCDKEPEEGIDNCKECVDGLKLLNKNCESDCPDGYYDFENKCVSQCPDHTETRPKLCRLCTKESENKCIYLGEKTELADYKGKCTSCDYEYTYNIFKANEEFQILDDCYQDCSSCSQRGTTTRMNCILCKDSKYVVKETGNCVESGITIDYHYQNDATRSYEKCYETCKTCHEPGDVVHHHCDSCKDNYQFDPSTSGNCVEFCQFYWYIDPVTQQFTCTTEEKCPSNLPYFTEINKGCVEECSAVISNGARFFYRYKDKCVPKCPENSMEDNLLYACHSLDDVDDMFTHMSNYISQGSSAENLLVYSSDHKKYFHIFNTTKIGKETYEKDANNIGTSIVDLSNCIATLKQIYGLADNAVLYIGILDVIRDDTSAPQFEYTIHNHLGTKLDINLCKNNEVKIIKSLNHSNSLSLAKDILANYNYDIINYDKDNPFFCDVCATFDYDRLDSYDVLLDDRFSYYYNNQDYYFCEDNCDNQLTKVNLTTSRVECVCTGATNSESYQKQNFNKYQKFTQNCKDSYMQYFKCAKNVFNKNLFKNNVGNYLALTFIVSQVGSVLLFNLFSKKPMMSHIHDVLIKRNKKDFEKDSQDSYSHSGSSNSGSGSRSYSRSGSSRSGDSRSNSESGSGSGSESQSMSRSDSPSGSKGGSKSDNKSNNKSEKNNASKAASGRGSKSNPPPKSQKTKYAFVSIDNKENNNNNDNDIFNLKIEKEEDNDNKVNEVNTTNNEDNKSNAMTNKNAPNPIGEKYAKRYINNRSDYLDNSYREGSYNFDLPKQKKKKKNDDDDESEEEEEEEEEENNENNGENNGENNNNGNNGPNNATGNAKNKPKKKGKKNNELPPAVIPVKTELEKFKDESKKFKKFTFFELYWFIIRKKHRIISLFYKKDIYDLFPIKFSLLILSLTIDLFITTIFIFEFEIRKLFEQKMHIDYIYAIFMGLFCTILSTVIMRIVDYLMEYRMNFKKYEILQKYENDHSNYFNSLNNMIKGFKQKMIIFYVINFIFSTFTWYIVSSFIGTYYNTRNTWGIMIGINIGLSIIFPFIYYFVAVLLQYKGIHKDNFKLYNFGMIMLKI